MHLIFFCNSFSVVNMRVYFTNPNLEGLLGILSRSQLSSFRLHILPRPLLDVLNRPIIALGLFVLEIPLEKIFHFLRRQIHGRHSFEKVSDSRLVAAPELLIDKDIPDIHALWEAAEDALENGADPLLVSYFELQEAILEDHSDMLVLGEHL